MLELAKRLGLDLAYALAGKAEVPTHLLQGPATAVLKPESKLQDPGFAAELARRAADEGWSVRETEKRASGVSKKRRKKAGAAVDPVVRALEEGLRDRLSTRVTIRQRRGGKGSIEIEYHGSEDFERVYELITGQEVAEVVE